MTHTGRATATVGNTVVASTDKWEVVEGNVYFPPDSIDRQYFATDDLTTVCPWKGTASYYNVVVGGKVLPAAAWYYPTVKEKAKNIEGFIAFCEFYPP
jgi:uncharacterized protein (DUF427 family)